MYRSSFTLWSDTVFFFFALFLLAFCVFRFYLPSWWTTLLLALPTALAGATLLHLRRRARRRKKHAAEGTRKEMQKFAFHLAMDSPERNAELIANSLNALHADLADAPASQTDDTARPRAEKAPYAQIENNTLKLADGRGHIRFQFEKVTADELRPAIRDNAEHATVFAAAFTEEAVRLAHAFGISLRDIDDVYALVKEAGCMPDPLIEPPAEKRSLREKLAFRLRKSAWRGYAFSGSFLLLFSLFTIFPLYYVISGGILLAFAAILRLFGKDAP